VLEIGGQKTPELLLSLLLRMIRRRFLLLQNKSAEGAYYYINDHLGAPQIITDDSRAVVWKAKYLPFGKVNISVAQVENNLRFPGQYFDAETGLHYNWNRYYNPETGRYIAADPIGLDGGMNLYAYVGGDPVNFTDPEGLIIQCGKCLYYGRKVSKLQDECRKELGPNPTAEDICNFINKYGGSWLSEAILNCAKSKKPDIYRKWLQSCFKCGWGGGPKPKPQPR